MKTFLLTLLIIPILSFGQLSKKEKASIESYLTNTCGCVNDLMSVLDPKAVEVVLIFGEKGQEQGMKEVELMVAEMNADELSFFKASFEALEDPELLDSIDECFDSGKLQEDLLDQLDEGEGDAFSYFLAYLDQEEVCELMKTFYQLGVEAEE